MINSLIILPFCFFITVSSIKSTPYASCQIKNWRLQVVLSIPGNLQMESKVEELGFSVSLSILCSWHWATQLFITLALIFRGQSWCWVTYIHTYRGGLKGGPQFPWIWGRKIAFSCLLHPCSNYILNCVIEVLKTLPLHKVDIKIFAIEINHIDEARAKSFTWPPFENMNN